MIESEFFGYVQGSFTGANQSGKMGVFEYANKGTVFLDEIAEVPLHLQPKLLRVIQKQEVTRIGSNETKKLDLRL